MHTCEDDCIYSYMLSFIRTKQPARSALALFLFVRALEVGCRLAYLRKYVPFVPHMEVIAISLSSLELGWALSFARVSYVCM